MEQYLIHTCPKRKWYVDEFLVPSMKQQGIKSEQIKIYNDSYGEGQLVSLQKSLRLTNNKDTWHLQDDIVISKNFKALTEEYNEGVVCGFCNKYSSGPYGYVSLFSMWYSMPCIRIPADIFRNFVTWLQDGVNQRKFKMFFDENKHDDVLFEYFLKEAYPGLRVWNVNPNMVNHIDHLIGGSLINKNRAKTASECMATYWDEIDIIVDIKNKLMERRKTG